MISSPELFVADFNGGRNDQGSLQDFTRIRADREHGADELCAGHDPFRALADARRAQDARSGGDQKGDILYDMGSGDGRIVIEAAKKYGIRGVGVDLNPELVAKARENAKKEGVSDLVEFRAQDGLTVDISEATVVTLYMFKWFNNALRPKLQKLKSGSRVVAHDFDIDDWKPSRIEYVKPPEDGSDYAESRTLYIWKVGETPTIN